MKRREFSASLLAAGALLALGLKELLDRREDGAEPPAWTKQLDRFGAMPLPLLLQLSLLCSQLLRWISICVTPQSQWLYLASRLWHRPFVAITSFLFPL